MQLTIENLINYIKTPEGLLIFIGLIIAIATFFVSTNKKIMKQKGGENSTNIQAENIHINE